MNIGDWSKQARELFQLIDGGKLKNSEKTVGIKDGKLDAEELAAAKLPFAIANGTDEEGFVKAYNDAMNKAEQERSQKLFENQIKKTKAKFEEIKNNKKIEQAQNVKNNKEVKKQEKIKNNGDDFGIYENDRLAEKLKEFDKLYQKGVELNNRFKELKEKLEKTDDIELKAKLLNESAEIEIERDENFAKITKTRIECVYITVDSCVKYAEHALKLKDIKVAKDALTNINDALEVLPDAPEDYIKVMNAYKAKLQEFINQKTDNKTKE